jgi:glutamate-1-semialdehyde 2,1-aminomutase
MKTIRVSNESRDALYAAYEARTPGSRQLYEQARDLIPNAVNHDVRYLEPYPLYIARAKGAHKWDVDGNEYIDNWVGHGALIMGHNYPSVVRAVEEQVQRGTHLGGNHEMEVEWARLVTEMIPSAEMVRFGLSGTEMTMLALRVARAYAGKDKVLKLQRHFHGWNDYALIGLSYPFDAPASSGIPAGIYTAVAAVPPNDLEEIEAALATREYAALILEPGGGANDRVPFHPGVLAEIRELTAKYGVVLIFDEAITGFRYAPGGAQQRYGIIPDLTTLGKILGGGLPSAALCGKREIMEMIGFRGDAKWDRYQRVQHSGTFNAHPLAAAAGVTVLRELQDGGKQAYLDSLGDRVRSGINEVFRKHGLQACCYGESSIYHVFLNNSCPRCQTCNGTHCDNDFETMARGMGPLSRLLRLARLVEGLDEVADGGYLSTAHTEKDIGDIIAAYDRALGWLE